MESAAHYARLLAPIYLWMAGGADAAFKAAEAEIGSWGVRVGPGTRVLDLGAGIGMHAIPAARRGALVTAIDSSPEMIAVLEGLRGELPVKTVHADLIDFPRHVSEAPDLVLCLGDTLTHLRDANLVLQLARQVAAVLAPGGAFVLSFRDYTRALEAEHRFIPVRGDDDRILTCFLEYGEATVRVHDILSERSAAGWKTTVSSYTKLRLAPDDVARTLAYCGLQVRREAGPGGMVRLVARQTARTRKASLQSGVQSPREAGTRLNAALLIP